MKRHDRLGGGSGRGRAFISERNLPPEITPNFCCWGFAKICPFFFGGGGGIHLPRIRIVQTGILRRFLVRIFLRRLLRPFLRRILVCVLLRRLLCRFLVRRFLCRFSRRPSANVSSTFWHFKIRCSRITQNAQKFSGKSAASQWPCHGCYTNPSLLSGAESTSHNR